MSQDKTDLHEEQVSATADTPDATASDTTPQMDDDMTQHADSAPSPETEGTEQTSDNDVETLQQALQAANDEVEKHREQALRAAAEAENVRKRAQRDVESARKFALEKFATELLGVRDSLEMGLKASQEEQADVAKVAEGLELTGRMLASAMEKFGIEVVNPEGEAFDPQLHEAMSMMATAEQAPNTVVSVIQKGYMLNGRVLRAAMVVVAKAPDND